MLHLRVEFTATKYVKTNYLHFFLFNNSPITSVFTRIERQKKTRSKREKTITYE